jgi:hypothetical protein
MRLASVSALVFAVLLAGCSQGKADDGSKKQCVVPFPCGGDLVGSWRVDSACFGSSFLVGSCQKSVDSSGVSASGTISYGADGSYSSSITYTGTYIESYPAACIPSGASCADFGASLGYPMPCTSAADGSCACPLPASGVPVNDLGTYSISDTTLRLSSTLGQQTTDFCVHTNGTSEVVRNTSGEVIEVRSLSKQ